MSRRIALNLELNRRLSKGGSTTPRSDKSIETVNSSFSNKTSNFAQRNKLIEIIDKNRENLHSRLESRRYASSSGYPNNSSRTEISLRVPEIQNNIPVNIPAKNTQSRAQLAKYANFITKKMQKNDFFKNLYEDRIGPNGNFVKIVENDHIESALLKTLQLLSDMIVHTEDYIPKEESA
ncbi:hypothetical protein SteCoe_37926 [Stentor coeruleus]|uniref:Uncharacterized protein n=1 Tax=Stentor coeruleus TaxID=5963 RepID=A0A1R2AM66_9CILI|nr:hypothetical protein SteCoe_37926 [Stentor coeruleus]